MPASPELLNDVQLRANRSIDASRLTCSHHNDEHQSEVLLFAPCFCLLNAAPNINARRPSSSAGTQSERQHHRDDVFTSHFCHTAFPAFAISLSRSSPSTPPAQPPLSSLSVEAVFSLPATGSPPCASAFGKPQLELHLSGDDYIPPQLKPVR